MALMVVLLGANPLEVARAIYTGSVGNPFNISQTIITTGILIATAFTTDPVTAIPPCVTITAIAIHFWTASDGSGRRLTRFTNPRYSTPRW